MIGDKALTAALCAAAVVACAGRAVAQCELIRAKGGSAIAYDHTGAALALSRNTAQEPMLLAGAPDHNGAGHVYAFRFAGGAWVSAGEIAGRGATYDDDFGAAVSLDDPDAAVGAPKYKPASKAAGLVTVYHRSGTSWTLQDAIYAEADGDDFGGAVNLRNGVLFIGAPGRDQEGQTDLGAVYVYENSGGSWMGKGKLIPPAGQRYYYTWFGKALARHNSAILVGAPGAHQGGVEDVGVVQSYVRDAGGVWQPKFQFVASDKQNGAEFGAAVAVHGDVAIVGAPKFDASVSAPNSGKAYVYRRVSDDSWTLEDTLESPTPGNSDYFGSSVAIRNDSAIVAAKGDQIVYIFQRAASGQWEKKATIEDPADGTNAFAATVAMYDGIVAVGDPNYDESGKFDMGCAYTFDLVECGGLPCEADYNGDGKLNVNDFIAFQSGWRKKLAKADWNDDGVWNVNDFIQFQGEFVDGCK